MSIYGNPSGGFGFPKTFILTDENGTELTGVVVGEKTVFDATPNDVRKGKVYAGEEGVKIGEKNIPSYNTSEGVKLIPAGSAFLIEIDDYDYTKLQAIICLFNTTISDSVSAEKIAISNNVYAVQSTTALSTITKDSTSGIIDFGIINTLDMPCLIRYFAYKEIY